jgi:hypothetical protein
VGIAPRESVNLGTRAGMPSCAETQPSAQGAARTSLLFYQIMGDVSIRPRWQEHRFQDYVQQTEFGEGFLRCFQPCFQPLRGRLGTGLGKISAPDPLAQWVALV